MDEAFQTHKLTEEGLEKAKTIAVAFNRLLVSLVAVCPVGREWALARTKLEEACFYAKKAMAKANKVVE